MRMPFSPRITFRPKLFFHALNPAIREASGFCMAISSVFAALEKTSPVPMGFEKIEGTAHGYYHLEEKRIAIDEGMSELQTPKSCRPSYWSALPFITKSMRNSVLS